MYGIEELKSRIVVTENEVICPVKECLVHVKRQRVSFKKMQDYYCDEHGIFISPSTFEYYKELDNIIWNDETDINLLRRIKKVKRESRMARDNSEDAVTWNIFRYLEIADILEKFLRNLNSQKQNSVNDIIYWSYSQKENGSWSQLNRARIEFGEQLNRSSEPDIILITDSTLFFVECKLLAGNKTTPSNKEVSKKYTTGGNEWYGKVFRSEYNNVAITEGKYELLRFWLLGTWLAEQLGLSFYLINVVPDLREQDIEERFSKHIYIDESKKFKRISWESLYQFIKDVAPDGKDKDIILNYFTNKTIGYKNRRLQPAFNLQRYT